MATAKRDFGVQAGAVSRLASDFKVAANCLDPVLQADPPRPVARIGAADAVVSTTTSRPASNVSAVIAGSLIAAGAVVPQGVLVPARSLVTGIPGRVWCELSEAEIAANRHNGEVYRRLLDIH
jgi:hypothetical protein